LNVGGLSTKSTSTIGSSAITSKNDPGVAQPGASLPLDSSEDHRARFSFSKASPPVEWTTGLATLSLHPLVM